jgi:hypothetical protein
MQYGFRPKMLKTLFYKIQFNMDVNKGCGKRFCHSLPWWTLWWLGALRIYSNGPRDLTNYIQICISIFITEKIFKTTTQDWKRSINYFLNIIYLCVNPKLVQQVKLDMNIMNWRWNKKCTWKIHNLKKTGSLLVKPGEQFDTFMFCKKMRDLKYSR